MSAPTPRSAESVADEIWAAWRQANGWPVLMWGLEVDTSDQCVTAYEDLMARIAAALTAHATAAVAVERERCARVAMHPYSDEVEAFGPDEPAAVGAQIAAAIRRAPEVEGRDA